MKLKALKVALKQWRRSSFDNPYAKIKDIRGKLKVVHTKLGSNPLNAQLQRDELALQDELGKWQDNEESE